MVFAERVALGFYGFGLQNGFMRVLETLNPSPDQKQS